MLSEELVDIATRHQVYLERYKAGQIKKTDALFVQLNRDLVRALDRLPTQNLGALTVLQRQRLLADIRNKQIEAYQKHLDALILQLKLLADFEREFELESIDEVTEDDVEPDDGQDDDGAGLWALIEALPMSATGALLMAWLTAWPAHETSRATDLVRKASAEGWTTSRLKQAYIGTRANGYRDGLVSSSRRNTATVINTAVQHVSAAARQQTMERTIIHPRGFRVRVNNEGIVTGVPRFAGGGRIKVGDNARVMGYRWVSILDNVTSQLCRSLDGRVFRFGQGPLPPAHPNCRSSIIAEMIGRWLKRGPTGRFVRRDERSATGAHGTETVDGNVTYYEWLKTQPPAFQDDALGKTRAKLFRDGGMSAATFSKLNLGRNFQPLTLAQMRRLKPNAFRRAGV